MIYRLITLLFVLTGSVQAADITLADVTSTLGPNFIQDDAVIGGNNNTTANFNRDVSGVWTAGSEVNISGIGWASKAGGTLATSATVTFTDLGPDDLFGTADDALVGTVTDSLIFATAGEYAWSFDTPIAFTSTGSTLRINIVSNGVIVRKTINSTSTNQDSVKLSIAGTFTGGPPVVNTATASGNWDQINWDTGSGTANGGLGDSATALIGQYNTVVYRGIPATETVATLNLGQSSSSKGQGRLRVSSGSLSVSGSMAVGRNHTQNDSFLELSGGNMTIQGDANFGMSALDSDGALTISGGSFAVNGNLNMGHYHKGGAMMRFLNPGSSAAVDVIGELNLGSCVLDLTFDGTYSHVPGTVITLVSYGSRYGQFKNFRHGDEFNCGPNRYRIDYDVPNGGNDTITLTSLANYNPTGTQPNIIFILSDDQGYADIQLNGEATWAAKYPMPRLQTIADAGVRFSSAYVTGGVCHPSRCGILTGIYQQRIGVDTNSAAGVSVVARSVPRRLQSLGYRTYGVGKWHMGETVEYHPNNRGFDQWYGMWLGARSYYSIIGDSKEELTVFQDQMEPDFVAETGEYLTDRIGDKTVEFIDDHVTNHASQPFYIYMSFTAVHGPIDIVAGDPRFTRLQNEFSLTVADYAGSPALGTTVADSQTRRHQLAAMTLALDENIGKVLDKVSAEGLSNNTIIVYMTDNGGTAQNGGGNSSINKPLRGSKGGNCQDGSIRVPCAMQWPGAVPSGQVLDTPISSLDFMATFVKAGGAPAAVRNGLDGLDLEPLLKDGVPLSSERVLTFRGGGNLAGGSAIRKGDWKLLIDNDLVSPVTTLHNITTNIGEMSDVSGANPDIVADLLQRFSAWEARTVTPFQSNGGIVLDAGLQPYGIHGGYRLKNETSGTQYLSGPIRFANTMASDWGYSFYARSNELSEVAGAKLVYALSDSTNRANFIRLVMDYENSQISIEEGKTGGSATVSVPSLPKREFDQAKVSYTASNSTLVFSLGGVDVSLVLSGSYSDLKYYGVGASAMEGELTSLRASSLVTQRMATSGVDDFEVQVEFANDIPFGIIAERSNDLNTFQKDEDILIESLGGGKYRATGKRTPAAEREFFRMQLDQS
jgi:arylsulfatase A-like enzyme